MTRGNRVEVHAHLEMVSEYEDEIHCPYCGELQDNDEGQYPVTFHGETGWEEMRCQDCDAKFYVREHVSRDYDVAKGQEKQDIQEEVDKKLDQTG
jgi:DNA-directed RNA polymerase subunit RPC12/RpoP